MYAKQGWPKTPRRLDHLINFTAEDYVYQLRELVLDLVTKNLNIITTLTAILYHSAHMKLNNLQFMLVPEMISFSASQIL